VKGKKHEEGTWSFVGVYNGNAYGRARVGQDVWEIEAPA
jgi:hypothetical protein